jgi:hypothetical protein
MGVSKVIEPFHMVAIQQKRVRPAVAKWPWC